MAEDLSGYQGKAFIVLKNAKVRVGDLIKVTQDGEVIEGTLMPRYELADDEHIVVKLKNGYNVGVRIHPDVGIQEIGVGAKPAFVSPISAREKEGLPTVAIVSTGGTIASRIDYRTGAVRPALTSNDLLSVVPELSDVANLRTEVLSALLSENIYAPHWIEMAKTAARYIEDNVDGVVICHGTDTMAYTSAALSFALQNLPVPIILVGSQRSSDRPSSDASMNLVSAVRAASYAPMAEVMVCMHETIADSATVLLRGTRVRKLHTSRRDAFKAVNADPLGRVDADKIVVLAENYPERDSSRKLLLRTEFSDRAAFVKFYPGFDPKVFDWYREEGYKGLILEGTGLGHVSEQCFAAIEKAVKSGVFVGMCSQCMHGRVNMKVYDTGRDLLRLGVTPLEDMLSETAFVKLSWVLGQHNNMEEVREMMVTSLAGEISFRSVY